MLQLLSPCVTTKTQHNQKKFHSTIGKAPASGVWLWIPNFSYVILVKLLDFLASDSSPDIMREFKGNIRKMPWTW